MLVKGDCACLVNQKTHGLQHRNLRHVNYESDTFVDSIAQRQ